MKKYFTWLLALLWLISLFYLQFILRSRFHLLWVVYSMAFASYLFLVFTSTLTLKQGIFLAIIIRLCFLFSEPLLSDDYYRFIWDGALTHAGINPATYTPREISSNPEWIHAPDGFFEKLNSPDYYAVYPPVAQTLFYFSFLINDWNVEGHLLWIRSILIIADLIIIWLLFLLLKQNNLPLKRMLIYALNPLIIVEFIGNIHFDGLMIFGLLAAVYFANQRRYSLSSVGMAFSVLAKMLTLPLIPFLGKDLSRKERILFTTFIFSLVGLCFALSFGHEANWLHSISLWFNHFEFNASIYYLLSALGYALKGYNVIGFIGPCLVIVIIVGYTWIMISYFKGKIKSPATAMLLVITFYLLFSTTIHPWYIGILLTLCVFSLHLYPIVWTYLVFLSYSHYEGGLSAEHYPLIALEYLLLGLFMYIELKRPFLLMRWANHKEG